MHHMRPVVSHNMAPPNTGEWRKGHGSLNNHTLLKTTITHIVCAKGNDQKGTCTRKEIEEGGRLGLRTGGEKLDSSIRPPRAGQTH